LQKTLVIAQQTSDEMKNGARRESDAIIQEARLKAEQIIAAAEEKVKGIIRDYEDIKKDAQVFRVKFRSLLRSQLELVGEDEEIRFDEVAVSKERYAEKKSSEKADFIIDNLT